MNLSSTLRLLEICREQSIKNFVFVSSSSVYGNDTPAPFSEKANADKPVSPYAASKRGAELFCSTYSHLHGIKTAILRFFSVYGPRQPGFAICKFANLMLEGKPVPVFGNGNSTRDFTFVSDVIEGTLRAGNFLETSPAHTCEVFNLGSSSPVQLKEVIRIIEKHLHVKAKVNWFSHQAGNTEDTFADMSKSHNLLGYKPKISIDEGIKTYINWIQANRQ